MGTGSAFVSYLKHNLQLIDDCVLAHVPKPPTHSDQASDLNEFLYDPLRRFVGAGGKRIRPALCLLGAEAVGADPRVAMPAAAAVELFQAAALIHDDIADQSTLRRGAPCLHVAEGVGPAINAGDAALVAVTSCIVRQNGLSPQARMSLLEEVVSMEERTLEGQALDLGWARDDRWNILESDYLAMARCKTAYYSAAVPLAMGAICGGGNNDQVKGLRHFGMYCGLAFQIQDDLLNLVGSAEAQGKDFRSDITEGKRTLVMVRALEHLGKEDRSELVRILSSKTTDVALMDRAVDLVRKTDAIEYARAYAQELTSCARTALGTLDIAESARTVLISMSNFFIERTS